MFTMGHMAAAITSWAGEDAVLDRIAAQFRAPASMGDVIVAGGRVRAIDGGRVTLALWVRVQRGDTTEWPIKKGDAVLRLGEPAR
jgi:acyl-CoA thioesterase FadM